jgi:hypothetical protein
VTLDATTNPACGGIRLVISESLARTPPSEENTMPDTATIRFVSYDRDPETDARTVSDIREKTAPARIGGSRSFTALSKDERRRELMVAFALEVDRLLAGEIDDISVFVVHADADGTDRA